MDCGIWRMVLAAAVLAALGPPVQAEPFRLMDGEGFAAEMLAGTFELPAGWQGKGRVAWNKPCSGNEFYEVIFAATSPDGQTGLRIMPGHFISWNDVLVDGVDPFLAQLAVAQAEAQRNDLRTQFRKSNCHVGQVASTQGLIDALILAKRPEGAQVVAVEPNAEGRAAQQAAFGTPQPGMKVAHDSVVVHLTHGGMEERAYLSWYQFADDPSMRVAGMPGYVFQSTYVEPISLVWAPAGRAEDLAAAEAALKSFRVDAGWLAEVRKVQDARNQQRARDRAAANAAQQDANRARQEAFDRQNAAFLDMIRQ